MGTEHRKNQRKKEDLLFKDCGLPSAWDTCYTVAWQLRQEGQVGATAKASKADVNHQTLAFFETHPVTLMATVTLLYCR